MNKISSSKLIHNLSILSKSDLERFSSFVHSPFFNKHQYTIQLCDYLMQHKDQWHKITKENISEHLFPNQTYKAFRVDNVISYLMQLLIRYLEQIGMEKRLEVSIYALEKAYEKGMYKLLESQIPKIRKRIAKLPVQDAHYQWSKYMLSVTAQRLYSIKATLVSADLLIDGEESLDAWYIEKKLELSSALHSTPHPNLKSRTLALLDPLVKLLRTNSDYIEQKTSIQLYFKIFELLTHPEIEDFYFDLKQFMNTRAHYLDKEQRSYGYQYLLNYGIRKVNANHNKYDKEVLDTYKKLLLSGELFYNDEISQNVYANIIALACKTNEYQWARTFAEEHAKYLPDKDRTNAYNLNLATINFYAEDYEEVTKLLNRVVFTNIFYQLKAKQLQIKTYFETRELQLLETALDNFRLFTLRNQKLPKHQQKGTKNFLKYTRKASKLLNLQKVIHKQTFQKKVEQLLQEVISQDQPILHKEWLLKKLREVRE